MHLTSYNFEFDFQKHLKKNNLELNLLQSKMLINKYIKAEFVRQLFGEAEYYEQLLPTDAMIKKVLER